MTDKKSGDVIISPSIDPENANNNSVNVKFEPTSNEIIIENGVAEKSSLDSPMNVNNIELNQEVEMNGYLEEASS
jgi:hypothetical protein